MPNKINKDGTVTFFWRNAQATEYWGAVPQVRSQSGSDADVHAAKVELESIKQEIKDALKLNKRKALNLASKAETENGPRHSLRRLAAILLTEAYANVSEGRRRRLMRMVDRMERIQGGDVDVRTIKYDTRLEYRDEVVRLWNQDRIQGAAHYKPPGEHGIFAEMSCLTEVLKLAQKMEVVDRVVPNLPAPKERSKTLVLDESMLAAICREMASRKASVAGPHNPQIFCALAWFEYHCACRSAEGTGLLWRDVVWSGDPGTITFRDTKNGTDHTLPLFDEVRPILEQMHQLELPRPFPVTPAAYRHAFAEARDAAWAAGNLPGVDADQLWEITPHLLRHSAITHMANSGANQHLVGTLANHKNPKTTQGYMRRNRETVEQLYQQKRQQAVTASSVTAVTSG